MGQVSDIVALVRTQIADVPEPSLDLAVQRAARNFCAQTWFVRRTIPLDLVAGQDRYSLVLEPALQLDIVGVRAVDRRPDENSSTTPLTSPNFDSVSPDARSTYPGSYLFLPYDLIVFRPSPLAPCPVNVEIAVQPSRAATVLPDELLTEYDDAIAAGALEILFGQARRDWTDVNESIRQGRIYASARDNAKGLSMRNFGRSNLRARAPGFIV